MSVIGGTREGVIQRHNVAPKRRTIKDSKGIKDGETITENEMMIDLYGLVNMLFEMISDEEFVFAQKRTEQTYSHLKPIEDQIPHAVIEDFQQLEVVAMFSFFFWKVTKKRRENDFRKRFKSCYNKTERDVQKYHRQQLNKLKQTKDERFKQLLEVLVDYEEHLKFLTEKPAAQK